MRRFILISALVAAALLVAGCRGENVPDNTGTGSLLLQLGIVEPDDPQTKASLSDGDYFKNVLVVIVNNAGKVVAKEYVSQDEGVATKQVYFTDLKVDTYEVYAYANIDHVDWQAETIEAVEKSLTAVRGGGGDPLDDMRVLATLTGTDTPAVPATSMLLTGHKQLSVGVNENIGQVDLLRPVVRFNVYVHNHTAFPIKLTSLSFSDFNVSVSYLLDHWTSEGMPSIPAGAVYRAMPASGYDADHPLEIPAASDTDENAGRVLAYSKLLYENASPEDYRMFATVQLEDTQHNILTKELTTNGVRRLPYAEVANLPVGTTKEVMLVNPTSNGGNFFGLYNGGVAHSAASFSLESSFSSYAEQLMKNSSIGANYRFTMSKTSEGRYMLMNGGGNLFRNISGNGEDGLFIAEGSIPAASDSYPITSSLAGALARFKDSKNRWLYSTGSEGKLQVTTGSENKGNRMWTVYEVYPKGSTLKFIDNETAQVKPLSCMLRNQELNVVMNVYFEELNRKLTFTVDNVYWKESNGHTSTHTFE